MSDTAAIAFYVERLPEIYQPIFGHPEYSMQSSRETTDRLKDIIAVHDALTGKLGRPLRVLDLGCAQGFISLTLASRGASVVGVDFLPENIELCKKLGANNPELDADFVLSSVQDFVASVEPDCYDMILMLSVIHHVAFHDSIDTALRTVSSAVNKSAVLLAELALSDEPLYWAEAQPKEPLQWFMGVEFVKKLRDTGTHLSPVRRPLYFASDRYWFVAGLLGEIESVRNGGHRFAKASFKRSRKYFFGSNLLLKRLSLGDGDGEVNREEFSRELAFLESVSDREDFPKLIAVEEDDSYLYLLRQKIEGELLSDLLDAGAEFDSLIVIREILEQNIELEKLGLYHSDIRPWNVLRKPNGRFLLIDYGAISKEKKDCFWPQNIYISFLVFIHELISGSDILTSPIRALSVTPYAFPGHLSHWVSRLSMIPLEQWSFERLLAELDASFLDPGATTVVPDTAREALMKMIEEAITVLAKSHGQLQSRLDAGSAAIWQRLREESERISNVHHDTHAITVEQNRLLQEHENLKALVSEFPSTLARLETAVADVMRSMDQNQRAFEGGLSNIFGSLALIESRVTRLEQSIQGGIGEQVRSLRDELNELSADLARRGNAAEARDADLAAAVSEVVRRLGKGFWARFRRQAD